MIDLTFWEPTMGAMDVIVSCLPRETQLLIAEQLQLLAVAQEDCGNQTASYYSRALSGEAAPQPKPKSKLAIVR